MIGPMDIVRKWQSTPGAFLALDMMCSAKENNEIQWDDRCLLPIGAAFTYLNDMMPQGSSSARASELTASWTWNKYRVSYIYDPDLAKTLCAQAENMEDTDVLPSDIIMSLPYPCVYISSNEICDGVVGFWAWIEDDVNTHDIELRIQWLEESGKTVPGILHLLPHATIAQCVEDTIRVIRQNDLPDSLIQKASQAQRDLMPYILRSLQLILYLVSDGADMSIARVTKKKNKTSKQNYKERVNEVIVGVHVGSIFRKARKNRNNAPSQNTGNTVAPHMRRGHWHRYWVGPKDGERKIIIKWIAPIIVHGDKMQKDTETYIPVVQ